MRTCNHMPREVILPMDGEVFQRSDYPWMTRLTMFMKGADAGTDGRGGAPGCVILSLYDCDCEVPVFMEQRPATGTHGGTLFKIMPAGKIPETISVTLGDS